MFLIQLKIKLFEFHLLGFFSPCRNLCRMLMCNLQFPATVLSCLSRMLGNQGVFCSSLLLRSATSGEEFMPCPTSCLDVNIYHCWPGWSGQWCNPCGQGGGCGPHPPPRQGCLVITVRQCSWLDC